MMAAHLLKRSKANTLSSQIRDAERQVLSRQRKLDIRTDALVRNVHLQMTAPTTLLLAGGAGLMLGELTKRQPSKFGGIGDKKADAETSPLKVAINLMTSIQTLYTALPMVWMMKAFYQPGASGQPPERQNQAATSASGRAENSRQPKDTN
jgi:hypothetical protein